jgi:glucose-1-phosphate thymidylyltransferase
LNTSLERRSVKNKMKSLVLASGFGTRLYPLTINKPKGLLEYHGKPLITHIVDKIPPDIDVLVNTNKKFEVDFRNWQSGLSKKITLCVEPVFSENDSMGAVGSVNYWIKNKNITDDLLVIASDNYFEFDLAQFIRSFNGINTLVAVHDIEDKQIANQFGVVKVSGRKITEFDEKPLTPKSSLVAIACYLFPQRIFQLLSQFCANGKKDHLGSFISFLVDNDEVHAFKFTEAWLDIGMIK